MAHFLLILLKVETPDPNVFVPDMTMVRASTSLVVGVTMTICDA